MELRSFATVILIVGKGQAQIAFVVDFVACCAVLVIALYHRYSRVDFVSIDSMIPTTLDEFRLGYAVFLVLDFYWLQSALL